MTDLFGIMRTPRAVLFGNGQRHALGRVAAALGRRALICTDERFAGTPEMAGLLAALESAGVRVQVFDRTQPDLPVEGVYECVAAHRAFQPDTIVGLGGGSCLDMAKLVSLLLAHGGEAADYYGEYKVPGPTIPVIALPTTSGTGSEVTPVAVLADSARDLKVGVSSPHLIPHTAICDPELTLTCPRGLTAIAGADALTHAIEALTAVRRSPDPDIAQTRVFVGKNAFSDQQALIAIRALASHLPRAVEDGSDLHARGQVMAAALAAGLAFGVAGTAAAHAIQYPIGALTHTAHGAGVATLMPYVMDFNAPACADDYADISRAMGDPETDPGRLAANAPRHVYELFARIGIPATLEGLGVRADQLDWIAGQSLLAARLVTNNPRPLDQAGIAAIVAAAHAGRGSFRDAR
ncbi:iron-containing alcohol dehydrogenase [Achromobacter veterisilvae]|jgi:alcohol dehydrogenase class IV|uniref:Iron-containing alcohol dehydrogenase n=1 Tax=Achromobacter veterisilvae TaxID=2069367 RepID=A0A446CNU7_9BURK|nr:iron-containing alcohol dehydrogenase [Achromobacter veterisilvae]SSW69393.1 Long-chain-alcohol dehydrogenase 1 [Achromobacter veterisilvae]